MTVTAPGYNGLTAHAQGQELRALQEGAREGAARPVQRDVSAAFPWAPRSPPRSAEAREGDDQAVYDAVAGWIFEGTADAGILNASDVAVHPANLQTLVAGLSSLVVKH